MFLYHSVKCLVNNKYSLIIIINNEGMKVGCRVGKYCPVEKSKSKSSLLEITELFL